MSSSESIFNDYMTPKNNRTMKQGRIMNSKYYIETSIDEEILQGDIIKHKDLDQFGFIITADCDIANNKNMGVFTWLEIITAEDYLEKYWAPSQLQKAIAKITLPLLDELSAAIKKTNPHLSRLTQESFFEWLRKSSNIDILSTIQQIKPDAAIKIDTKMNILRTALGIGSSENETDRLLKTLTSTGKKQKEIQEHLKSAFNTDGFPDFFFLPELPTSEHYGHVILLRNFRSCNESSLFKSALDARIDGQTNSYYRICRLQDDVRFSVTQKMAFLFTRIGMTNHFENACNAARDILVDGITTSGENK